MVIRETIFAMRLTRRRRHRPAGGRGGSTTFSDPQDHGFMYAHACQDPDGHVREVMWMDPSAVQGV